MGGVVTKENLKVWKLLKKNASGSLADNICKYKLNNIVARKFYNEDYSKAVQHHGKPARQKIEAEVEKIITKLKQYAAKKPDLNHEVANLEGLIALREHLVGLENLTYQLCEKYKSSKITKEYYQNERDELYEQYTNHIKDLEKICADYQSVPNKNDDLYSKTNNLLERAKEACLKDKAIAEKIWSDFKDKEKPENHPTKWYVSAGFLYLIEKLIAFFQNQTALSDAHAKHVDKAAQIATKCQGKIQIDLRAFHS